MVRLIFSPPAKKKKKDRFKKKKRIKKRESHEEPFRLESTPVHSPPSFREGFHGDPQLRFWLIEEHS